MTDITTTQPQEQHTDIAPRRHYDTIEQAHDSLIAKRDEAADKRAARPKPVEPKPVEDEEVSTETDAEIRQLAQQEAQTFAAGLLDFAQRAGIDPGAAERYMRAGQYQAVLTAAQQAAEQQISQLEDKDQAEKTRKAVKARVEALNQSLAVLAQVAQHNVTKQQRQAQQRMEREREKLDRAGVDESATRRYLIDLGFSEDEIDNSLRGGADHRLLVAFDKARRFDESRKSKPGKVLKVRKAKKQPANVSEIKTKATRNESWEDKAYRRLQEKRAARAQQ